jgi:hypothetical protein
MASVCAERVRSEGMIKLAKRSIALLEPDVVIYTNDIDFAPKDLYKNGVKTVFQYVVAVDYEDTLVSIGAKDATAAHATIKATRVERPTHFDQSLTAYNETDFIWYELDVTEQIKASKDETVHLEITEYHKRRRTPFPESVRIVDQ